MIGNYYIKKNFALINVFIPSHCPKLLACFAKELFSFHSIKFSYSKKSLNQKGESSFGFDHQVEKTITDLNAESSFSNDLDKVAIENFITNLQEQVVQNLQQQEQQQKLTETLNFNQQQQLRQEDNYSINNDEEFDNKLEANLSASSTTSTSNEEAVAAVEPNAEEKEKPEIIGEKVVVKTVEKQIEVEALEQDLIELNISEEIADLVNKIVQDVLLRAKEAVQMEIEGEEEEEAIIESSFDLIQKNELSEEELRLIEIEEQQKLLQQQERELQLNQVKFYEQNDNNQNELVMIEEEQLNEQERSEIDKNNDLVSYQKSPRKTAELTVLKEDANRNASSSLDNTTLSKKSGSKKPQPDVDCFSCNIL
jgi:hypothetical protein